jgi:hypothetical protein
VIVGSPGLQFLMDSITDVGYPDWVCRIFSVYYECIKQLYPATRSGRTDVIYRQNGTGMTRSNGDSLLGEER